MNRHWVLFLTAGCFALNAAGSQQPGSQTFSTHLKPFLAQYCVSCHGNEKQKADLNLQAFGDQTVLLENRKVWEKVKEMLASREMPPDSKPQPEEEQRHAIIRFIEVELARLDCDGQVNPGRVTLRRLNRNEYNNTIRDLVGVDFKPAADFPSDEVGYGFDNIGDVLSLPPILMEKYLAAAEQIATNAIVAHYRSGPPKQRIEAETLSSTANGSLFQDRALSLDTEGEAFLDHSVTHAGEHILRARAFGQQAGPDPTRLEVRVDGQKLRVFDVAATEAAPEIYELKTRLEPGKHRLAFAYINNYNVQDHPDPKLRGDRNLIIDFVEIEGPLGITNHPLPETHRRIIPCAPDHGHSQDCARPILAQFAKRAYRRPVADNEVNRLIRFIDLAKAEGGTFEEGIQLAVQAILTSPHFLFRWELDSDRSHRTDTARNQPEPFRPLNDFELASRLSYFVWSSMPDDELFRLAEQQALTDPVTLDAQVRRMLKDPKAKALVTNFASQWLTIRNLDLAAPDPKLFPHFDEELRSAMRKETELFFESVMRDDRSVLEFLDSDYTFLNERLARHYGMSGITGQEFRKVSLNPSAQRGGILTQASILTITSNPTRTSPVSRGKWILEQILGSPPPPPPPDVTELPEDKESIESASLRQRMEQHRSNPDCATCHNKMDPIGFAFENFDAVGSWRELDGKFPIDSSGVLPDGRRFQGPNDLKQILKTEESFVRSLAEKMLTFALGRGLEYYDKCTLDDICRALAGNHYRFSVLVTEIVKSKPFLFKKRAGDQT